MDLTKKVQYRVPESVWEALGLKFVPQGKFSTEVHVRGRGRTVYVTSTIADAVLVESALREAYVKRHEHPEEEYNYRYTAGITAQNVRAAVISIEPKCFSTTTVLNGRRGLRRRVKKEEL